MEHTQGDNSRQLRAAILSLLDANHRQQQSRLRLSPLALALDRLHFDVTLNDLVTMLQDLKDRGYVEFTQTKDKWTGRINLGEIQIKPAGRDLVERTNKDEAVDFD